MPSLSAHLKAEIRLQQVFERVRDFVAQTCPDLARVELESNCPQIDRRRKQSSDVEHRRSFAHAGHWDGVICAIPAAGKLGLSYLVGILLHEFGHEATGGGEGEADLWVLTEFGIPISYKGSLFLEWVDPELIREKGI